MKNRFKKILLWALAIAMLLPMLNAATLGVIAATTTGYIGNMDENIVKDVIAPADAPTLNMENNGGLRFATNINLTKYEALKQFCKQRNIKVITMGTLIAPLDYVKEAGEFSTEKLDALSYETPYLNVVSDSDCLYQDAKNVAPGYDTQYVASLINIKLNNRERDFAAIGYIRLSLVNNQYYTIYSYDNENMALVEKYSANLSEVAEKALSEDAWTEEERAKITDMATKAKTVSVSGAVTDFRYTRSQVYFTYTTKGQSFYNRLTYNGANGWRLQTNTHNYNHFKDIGAGQSLALYMGEGFNDAETPLQIVHTEDEPVSSIQITAEGTDASVTLSCNKFNMDFSNPEDGSLYNVNGMSLSSSGEISLTGKMNQTDAVYGGGERFGGVNQRGKSLNLYISDSYDLKIIGGTYVAIPLFSTSRGGGMFVNRYEQMEISFPNPNMEGNWKLTIKNDISDCYFFATGNIADVLQAYVDMTGHASLPEEWAQGYLVCRFQPDFTSLGGLRGDSSGENWYYNIEDIPDYSKYSYSALVQMREENITVANNQTTIKWNKGEDSHTFVLGDTLVNWDGSETYYTYITSQGNGYFKSAKDSTKYTSILDIPNLSECYLGGTARERRNLAIGDKLPHKKALTTGGSAVYYHYIIETGDEDFNYNGVLGESYFLRTSTKGAPAGAGVEYIVESLIDAGMTPTGVILEGVNWYDAAKNAGQWANLKKFVEYLNAKDIKVLLYSYLGYVTGSSMGSGYKSSYTLKANIYKYDALSGIGAKITTTDNIFKSDKTDNPDTASDGTQRYLDVTNPDAVEWYMNAVWDVMMELGIDGIKIDFCESLPNEGVYKKVKINGTEYSSVYVEYEWYDEGVFGGDEAHHAYPSFFTSAFYKAMEEKAALRDGDTGFVLLTRGGGIGSQRNPYMWAGDQTRRFRTLSLQLSATLSSGISGLPFMSYDMAGYAYFGTPYHFYGGQPQLIDDTVTKGTVSKISLADCKAAEEYESEIFVRALQYTVFGNLIQTHGDVRHLYQMTKEAQEIAALYNALHEELADYLQELSKIACDTGMPMIRHMILEYQDDPNVATIEDQFMYGDALLVAPILTGNSKMVDGNLVLDYASVVTRTVYLPEGEWIYLNTGETIVSNGMTVTVDANLAKIPVYLNTASEYAEQLQQIFAGETWNAIKVLANAQ